jgi:prepilin-type N-terminal cleavage/methylation domain-containing protein
MKKLSRTAFTLIELLVVIAIVGILSSLIVVTMSGVTQKATIAKAQVFSNSLRNSLMMDLVSEWKLDGSGVSDGGTATTTYTQDSWSGGNNCTVGGAPLVYSGSNCISGSCLSFNGSTDYLNCGNNSNLNIVNAITIEIWVNPIQFSGNQVIVSKSLAGDGYRIWTYSNNLRFSYYGLTTSSYLDTTLPSLNSWTHIVASYDPALSTKNLKIYKNGVLANSSNASGTATTPAAPFIIASIASATSSWFNGLIDGVRIYSVAISASQIKEQYYTGLNELLINGGINKEEYLSRINELAIK